MITLHFHLQPQYKYELFHIKLHIVDFRYAFCGLQVLFTYQKEEMLFLQEGWVENLGVQNWDLLVKRNSNIVNNKFT